MTDVYYSILVGRVELLCSPLWVGQCSRKRGQPLKKRKKSCFLDFEKNVKNVRSFTGHFITQPLITQLPEVSTGKSRSPTSNILLRSVDTKKNYATENCV